MVSIKDFVCVLGPVCFVISAKSTICITFYKVQIKRYLFFARRGKKIVSRLDSVDTFCRKCHAWNFGHVFFMYFLFQAFDIIWAFLEAPIK